MPRICTSASEPIDYCQDCIPSEQAAFAQFGDMGDGPDGRGNCFEHGTEHPPYEGEEYLCQTCKKLLTEEDN